MTSPKNVEISHASIDLLQISTNTLSSQFSRHLKTSLYPHWIEDLNPIPQESKVDTGRLKTISTKLPRHWIANRHDLRCFKENVVQL